MKMYNVNSLIHSIFEYSSLSISYIFCYTVKKTICCKFTLEVHEWCQENAGQKIDYCVVFFKNQNYSSEFIRLLLMVFYLLKTFNCALFCVRCRQVVFYRLRTDNMVRKCQVDTGFMRTHLATHVTSKNSTVNCHIREQFYRQWAVEQAVENVQLWQTWPCQEAEEKTLLTNCQTAYEYGSRRYIKMIYSLLQKTKQHRLMTNML